MAWPFGAYSHQPRPDDRTVGQEIEDRYLDQLAAWQITNGLNRMDLRPDQNERCRALEAARGNVANAKRLILGRRRARAGVMTDGWP